MPSPALYTHPAGSPVAATVALTLTLQRTTDPAPVRRTQSAAAWAGNVQQGLLTEAQLRSATPAGGYRLPTLADAQRIAYAAVAADLDIYEALGWWVAHRYLGAPVPPAAGPADGWEWWSYAGTPPQTQGRVTDLLGLAEPQVALGAADAWGLPCATPTEVAAGIPCTSRPHTVSQLRAVQAAGGRHLATLGEIRDEAIRAIQSAGTEAGIDAALELAHTRWTAAVAAPTEPAGPPA